ncbi:MAG: WxcM domain-containing protein [Parcubacteria group bacterium Gr01-1014_8]|nr:MAG: WxcM domain-containing protein [Parcubacteria group bacterium Gr01-1014_8]
MTIELRVKNSGLVPRTYKEEGERGSLFAAEDPHIPFSIRRMYVISGVDKGVTRGDHAHKKTDQVMFVVQGELTLHLDDGETKQSIRLTSRDEGIRLAPMLWHYMSDFTPDCMALVAASLPYNESDYIRDYEEFKKYARTLNLR